MSKCKTKAIQTDLDAFRHNQEYPGVIQEYSETCVTLKPWYILIPDILSTTRIFRTLLYSERWHIQNPRHMQNPAKYLR